MTEEEVDSVTSQYLSELTEQFLVAAEGFDLLSSMQQPSKTSCPPFPDIFLNFKDD